MKKILVVEDQDDIRDLIVALLSEYDVTARSSCELGLREIEAPGAQFDLVFTDYRIPNIGDGARITKAARQHLPGTPVLMASGSMETDPVRESGADLYLQKPFMDISAITKAVALLLNLKAELVS